MGAQSSALFSSRVWRRAALWHGRHKWSQPVQKLPLPLLAVLISLVLGSTMSAHAQSSDDLRRAPLRGISGVNVLVEDLPANVEALGLRRETIRTEVELRLRRNRVSVVSLSIESIEKETPTLMVTVDVLEHPRLDLYAVHVTVELMQSASLDRDRRRSVWVSTWSDGLKMFRDSRALPDVRSNVGELVDRFINDYLAANPRPALNLN